MAYVLCQIVAVVMSEASVHVYMALQSAESKVSEAGVTPKDISEWEELDMIEKILSNNSGTDWVEELCGRKGL